MCSKEVKDLFRLNERRLDTAGKKFCSGKSGLFYKKEKIFSPENFFLPLEVPFETYALHFKKQKKKKFF